MKKTRFAVCYLLENSRSELAVRMLSMLGLFLLYIGSSLGTSNELPVESTAEASGTRIVDAGVADMMIWLETGGWMLRSKVILKI